MIQYKIQKYVEAGFDIDRLNDHHKSRYDSIVALSANFTITDRTAKKQDRNLCHYIKYRLLGGIEPTVKSVTRPNSAVKEEVPPSEPVISNNAEPVAVETVKTESTTSIKQKSPLSSNTKKFLRGETANKLRQNIDNELSSFKDIAKDIQSRRKPGRILFTKRFKEAAMANSTLLLRNMDQALTDSEKNRIFNATLKYINFIKGICDFRQKGNSVEA